MPLVDDVLTQFLCGLLLIFGAAIFYVLWDNSCRKFDEVSDKIDRCMEPLSGRMLTTETLLEKYIKTDDDKEVFKQIVEYRRVYECRLNKLKDCLRRP